ncbi:MAG: sigma-70 family RNA polymerase sigma factor [Opitutales bacterium]
MRAGAPEGRSSPRENITYFLNEVESGRAHASEELLPLVYDDLRRHAARRMAHEPSHQTLQPTALVHEAWLRVIGRGQRWEHRAHFFGAAAEAMRRILIDNARRKARQKHGGGQERLSLEQVDLASADREERLLLIDEALGLLEKEDPEKARIVVLKFFGGHSNQEVAAMLAVSERTVERHWSYAKAWLYQQMHVEKVS